MSGRLSHRRGGLEVSRGGGFRIGGGDAKVSYVRLSIVVISGKNSKAWCREGLREQGVKLSARSLGLRHVLGWLIRGARVTCYMLKFLRCCEGFTA